MSELFGETQAALRTVIPAFGSVKNPADITAQFIADPALLRSALEIVLRDSRCRQLSDHHKPRQREATMRTRTRLLAVMIVVVLSVFLAFPVPDGAVAAQTITLRVGDQVGSELDYAPFWIAVEKGYLKEEGISIVRKTFPNGPVTLLSFDKGELDVATPGIGPALQAVAQGSDFVVVMSITKDNAPIVARAEVTSAKDLDGKHVGSPGLGTIQDTILLIYEKEHGIHVQHVYAKITDLISLLEKGEISAFIGWETVAAKAVLTIKGAHYLEPRPFPGAEGQLVVVTRSLAHSHPEVVTAFVRAILKGMRYYQRYQDAGLTFVTKIMNTPDALKVVRLAKNQVTVTQPYLNFKSSKIAYEAAVKAKKILPQKLPSFDYFVKRFVDYSYLNKAEASLKGWQPSQ